MRNSTLGYYKKNLVNILMLHVLIDYCLQYISTIYLPAYFPLKSRNINEIT